MSKLDTLLEVCSRSKDLVRYDRAEIFLDVDHSSWEELDREANGSRLPAICVSTALGTVKVQLGCSLSEFALLRVRDFDRTLTMAFRWDDGWSPFGLVEGDFTAEQHLAKLRALPSTQASTYVSSMSAKDFAQYMRSLRRPS